MKRMLWIWLMLVCLLAAPAQAEETVYILEAPGPCDTVAICDRPEGEAIAHYYTGAPVKALARQGENGQWAYVEAGGGDTLLTGWVNGAYLTRVPNPNSMPDLLHYVTPLADMEWGALTLQAGMAYPLMGHTETGLQHLLVHAGGVQSCFIPPELLAPVHHDLYAMTARETLLRDTPEAISSGISLYSGVAMDVKSLEADWCYAVCTANSDLSGYVPTRDLAFALDIEHVTSGCPSVRLTEELAIRDANGQIIRTFQPGTLALQLAATADERYIRTWEGDGFAARIPAGHAQPVGTGRLGLANGLNVCGFARLTREQTLYSNPGGGEAFYSHPAGALLPLQGAWNGWLQTPEGFLPADAAETCWLNVPEAGGAPGFYTVTLQEGGRITLPSGESYTAPGAYQFLLREGESLTLTGAARIHPQTEPAVTLDYFNLSTEGSGRLLGWFNTIYRGETSFTVEITALGDDSRYAVTPVGEGDLPMPLAAGETVQETLSITDFLAYQNCRVALMPGNG